MRRRNLLLYAFRSPSSVVQDWPEAGTYCRSSVQIEHKPGGASEGECCVPQVVQMKVGMSAGYHQSLAVENVYSALPVPATAITSWPRLSRLRRQIAGQAAALAGPSDPEGPAAAAVRRSAARAVRRRTRYSP